MSKKKSWLEKKVIEKEGLEIGHLRGNLTSGHNTCVLESQKNIFSFWAEQANSKYFLLSKLYFWLKTRLTPFKGSKQQLKTRLTALKSSKQQFIRLFQLDIPERLTHLIAKLVFPLQWTAVLKENDTKAGHLQQYNRTKIYI